MSVVTPLATRNAIVTLQDCDQFNIGDLVKVNDEGVIIKL